MKKCISWILLLPASLIIWAVCWLFINHSAAKIFNSFIGYADGTTSEDHLAGKVIEVIASFIAIMLTNKAIGAIYKEKYLAQMLSMAVILFFAIVLIIFATDNWIFTIGISSLLVSLGCMIYNYNTNNL